MRLLTSLLMLLCAGLASPARAHIDPHHVNLIYAAELTDINTAAGSYSQLESLLTLSRQRQPTIFLFGGSSLVPSLISSFDYGAHIIDILNHMNPDVMGVAKREFAFAEDELSLRAQEATFPMVLSNATDTLTGKIPDGLEPHLLIEKNGLKIGVLAIMHPSNITEYQLARLHIDNDKALIAHYAKQLREAGAHLVVLMIVNHHDYIRSLISEGTIDIVLQTNVHDLENKSAMQDKDFLQDLDRYHKTDLIQGIHNTNVSPNYIVVTKPNNVAVIDISWSTPSRQQLTWYAQFASLASLPPSPKIQPLVVDYTQHTSVFLGETITKLTAQLDTRRDAVRSVNNAFAHCVTMAMRDASHTDIALFNAGGIRGDRLYPKGHTLTRKDIAVALPFRDRIQILKITGAQLKDALENGVSQLDKMSGRLPHVSGMQFRLVPSAPVGERVHDIKIQGQPINLTRSYTMATSEFLANGGDGYASLKSAVRLNFSQQVTPLISDIVVSMWRVHDTLSPSNKPNIIVDAKEDL